MTDAREIFAEELKKIKNREIRSLAENFLACTPDYFTKAPASSTGKYHPEDERGEGGLVLHTKRTVKVVLHLCEAFGIVGVRKDLMIVAALLHDLYRYGTADTPKDHTDPRHSLTIAEGVQKFGKQHRVPDYYINFLVLLLQSHMGLFGPNPEVVENNRFAALFYIADYIASREDIEVKVSNQPKTRRETGENLWKSNRER